MANKADTEKNEDGLTLEDIAFLVRISSRRMPQLRIILGDIPRMDD